MGDVSGAHFQIITQKGKRKVKLIQRQRKKEHENSQQNSRKGLISNGVGGMTALPPLLLRSFAIQLFAFHEIMRR